MIKKAQSFLYPILDKRKHLPYEELYRYVLMLAVAIVACSVHVLFSIFFFVVGCAPLAISHVFGVGIFLLCYYLLQKRHYDMSGALLSAMILFSSMATIYMIGGDNYSIFYMLIVLLMIMVVPFQAKAIPVVFASVLPLIMVGAYLFNLSHIPPYDIGIANQVLSVMNIIVASFGTITMLLLERFVREFVDSFKQQEIQELHDKAYLDPLTELYNRRYAEEYFSQLRTLVADDVTYCVALADIDDFKRVNDTYGHHAGDVALQHIAKTFTGNTRKTDVVFRWGGEEFLLVIHTTLENTYKVLENIRKKVNETEVSGEGFAFHVSITAGIAKLDRNNVRKSLEACDRKLYEGKKTGKNKVVL